MRSKATKKFLAVSLSVCLIFANASTTQAAWWKTMTAKQVHQQYAWVNNNICNNPMTKAIGSVFKPVKWGCNWVKATMWRNGW